MAKPLSVAVTALPTSSVANTVSSLGGDRRRGAHERDGLTTENNLTSYVEGELGPISEGMKASTKWGYKNLFDPISPPPRWRDELIGENSDNGDEDENDNEGCSGSDGDDGGYDESRRVADGMEMLSSTAADRSASAPSSVAAVAIAERITQFPSLSRSQDNFAIQPRQSLRRKHGTIDASEFDAESIFSCKDGWAKVRRRNRSRDPMVATAHKDLLRSHRRRDASQLCLADARMELARAQEAAEEAEREDVAALADFRSTMEVYETAELNEDPALRPDPEASTRWSKKCPERKNVPFGEMYAMLKGYHDRHGHVYFPQASDPIPEDEPLNRDELNKVRMWLRRQRNGFKIISGGVKRKKTTRSHHYTALQKLGVFEGRWEKSFQDLVAFKEKYEHCDVPTKRTKWFDNGKLCNWVGTQRTEYRKLRDPRRAHDSFLTQERIDILEGVGFRWNTGKVRKTFGVEARGGPVDGHFDVCAGQHEKS